MSRARILVIDGHRHRKASGYGEVARGILLTLRSSKAFDVAILPGAPAFEHESLRSDWLERLPVLKDPSRADAILQIGQPGGSWHRYGPPTALYTMFDPSRPPLEVIASLRDHHADLHFVPNDYNRRYFAAHFFDVRVVPPLLDHKLFRPRPRSPLSRQGEFVFMFHGAFGFRKGIDLLLEAFLAEFRAGEARLHLHCPGFSIKNTNQILSAFTGRSDTPAVEIFHRTYSQQWIANFYNAAGAVVSLSRAEAWGLPISNAILCGRPVVVSRDWGMAEYLPADYPYFVEGERRPLASITDPRGADWRDRHGSHDNEYFEASVEDARRKLRAVREDPAEAERQAARAREQLLQDHHPETTRGLLEQGLLDLIARHRIRAWSEARLPAAAADGDLAADVGAGSAGAAPPKVSILVSCRDAAEVLPKTLDCLDRQSWPNLEILLADDGSSDSTAAILDAFARDRPHVRVLPRSEPLGWLARSNELLSNATGEFACLVPENQLIAPSYVEKLARALIEHPAAALSYGFVDVADGDGQHHLWSFDGIAAIERASRRGRAMLSMPPGWWVPSRGLIRSSALRRVGAMRRSTAGDLHADWTWLLALALRGSFVGVPEVLCYQAFTPAADDPSSTPAASEGRGLRERNALRRAGLAEIALSPLSPIEKGALALALAGQGVVDELARARRRVRNRSAASSA